MGRLHAPVRLYRDERGMSLVFVGVGFLSFFAATALAIDVGMLMTARAQAQNAADAAAHAGAVALAFDDHDDRSPSGPAVTNAIARAEENLVVGVVPSVYDSDVQFFQDSEGRWNEVEVTAHRTAARKNPLQLFIAPIFKVYTADISARARAEATPANTVDCVLPFMVPDRWDERTDPPFDSITSAYDIADDKKNPLPKPDVYYDADDLVNYKGYHPERDKGTQLILKSSNDTKVFPSIYNPIVLPGNGRGADEFRDAIAGCFSAEFEIGQDITVEDGNMVGPTEAGFEILRNTDPDAYWDTTCNCVKGSLFPVSPRVRPIPLYDPHYYETGKQNGRNADFRVANILGVFVEEYKGKDLYARITPITGTIGADAGPVPKGSFPVAIRIIR